MQVFISHSDETNVLAQKVSEALQRSGLEVWNGDQEILPGDNWAQKIAQALEESEAMVVLITPEALESTKVRNEINYALGSKNFNRRLIPVLVGSKESIPVGRLPWIFRHLNVIELPKHDTQEEGINQIAQALHAVA